VAGAARLPTRPLKRYRVAMKRSPLRRLLVALVLVGVGSCPWRTAGRVDAAALERDGSSPRLRVTIVGASTDRGVRPAREAIAFWNRELVRLGRRTHFDSATIRTGSIPDDLLPFPDDQRTIPDQETSIPDHLSAIPDDRTAISVHRTAMGDL